MPIDLWFPLALYYEDLPEGASQKEACVRYVYEALDQSVRARPFAWTGDVHGRDRIHEDPRFAWLTEAVGVHAWKYLERLGHDLDELEVHIQRAWPVISRPGQGVAGHSHHNAHLSAVYWIAASGDAGKLRFSNTARQNELSPGAHTGETAAYREFHPLNYGASEYEPVEGRLILFPAKQRHEVLDNDSPTDRLSISFDLVVTTRWDRPGGVHEFLMPPPEHWRRVPRPQPGPEVRTDRPMELAALSRYAEPLDGLSLPPVADHALWRSTVYPHCASRQDWIDEQRRRSDAIAEMGELGPGWHAVPATPDGWSTFRNCVDRVHHYLANAGASTLGTTVTAPMISSHRVAGDAPFARASTGLEVYLRLDHGDGASAIELQEESEVVGVEPGSLVIVSGYRRHRLLGEGTFLRFGVDVPTLARRLRPDSLTGSSGPVDDMTAFLMATAIPLTAPCPVSTTIDRKLADVDARRRRRHRHEQCPVVRAYLVEGADPGAATDEERAKIRSYGATTDTIVEGHADIVRHLRLLDSSQCDRLIAFGRHHMRSIVPDSVDGLPEYQVNLDVDCLSELVGTAAVQQLLELPAAHGALGLGAGCPPPVSMFLRLFSPDTRPYITFHSDVSCWTVNVPLDDDDPDGGGRLLMLYGSALRAEPRSQGVALSHSGEVVHGVSRIKAGERWSLIALFTRPDHPAE